MSDKSKDLWRLQVEQNASRLQEIDPELLAYARERAGVKEDDVLREK